MLKTCVKELSPVFNYIFNKSLQVQHVPKVWKYAVVVPVPKSSSPKALYDFRPVALTSILTKTLEKLVKKEILRKTKHTLDPKQFAYRPHRGVKDATVMLLNLLAKHLKGNGSHARLLLVDFSSAFNTIQPHVLIDRLLEQFTLSNNIVGWILDFLTNRTQRVRVNITLSDQVCSSSLWAPQKYVCLHLCYLFSTQICVRVSGQTGLF